MELFKDMKRNKIEPDKVTFGTYYQAFLISKKHNVAVEKGLGNAPISLTTM